MDREPRWNGTQIMEGWQRTGLQQGVTEYSALLMAFSSFSPSLILIFGYIFIYFLSSGLFVYL